MVTFQQNQKQMKALIARRHPEYTKYETHWTFLNDTYKSDRDWFAKHIFKYIKEGEATYDNRVTRAYRFNHTREVVDLVNKYLFKTELERSVEAPTVISDFWKSATLGGLDIDQFMRQVSSKASRFGRVYIVVDSNRTESDGEIVSKADAKAAGFKVYAYVVSPEDVLDMSYDEDGEFNWVLIREIRRDDDDPFENLGELVYQYRLWTKEGWALYTVDGKKNVHLAESGEHGVGEVPVIKSDHIECEDLWRAPALIDDIAYLDRAIANYLSNLDQIIQDQTFSQLIMPAQALMQALYADDTKTEEAEAVRKRILELGVSQVLVYDGEGGGEPKYISPDPRQAELIMKVIKQIINEIYHTVGLAGERTKQDNAVGIDNSSGVAKAFDFERVNALLSAKANALENTERRLARMVGLWQSAKIKDVEKLVEYAKDFDTRGLAQEFEIAANLQMLEIPLSIRKHQVEQMVGKMYPLLPSDVETEFNAELKNWDNNEAVDFDISAFEPNRQGQVTEDTEKKPDA